MARAKWNVDRKRTARGAEIGVALLSMLGSALGIAACGGSGGDSQPACTTDFDCPGAHCVDGRCVGGGDGGDDGLVPDVADDGADGAPDLPPVDVGTTTEGRRRPRTLPARRTRKPPGTATRTRRTTEVRVTSPCAPTQTATGMVPVARPDRL